MYKTLTDAQWLTLEPLFPTPIKRGRGKPHAPWRHVLNSILFILQTGLKWDALPKRDQNPGFAPKSVAHRWFIRWEREGFLTQILSTLEEFAPLTTQVSTLPRRKRAPKVEQQEAAISA